MTRSPVLRVEGLSTQFSRRDGVATVLEDLSFDVFPGETVALVGESGSGKSVAGLALLGLLPPAGRISSGRILFQETDGAAPIDLAGAAEKTLRRVRGGGISMVFQEPMSALNPSLTVGFQIAEGIRLHQGLSKRGAAHQAEALLAKVGVADPRRRFDAYPHELSGGMRQRVMIAMAVACRPRLMIADEPTTALDVATQAQVLRLLRDLQAETGMGLLFITHNLALAPMIADRIMVLYAGQVVETGPAARVLERPRHPYTQALLACLPVRHLPVGQSRRRLPTIEGAPPALIDRSAGCGFRRRCPQASPTCAAPGPKLKVDVAAAWASRCILDGSPP